MHKKEYDPEILFEMKLSFNISGGLVGQKKAMQYCNNPLFKIMCQFEFIEVSACRHLRFNVRESRRQVHPRMRFLKAKVEVWSATMTEMNKSQNGERVGLKINLLRTNYVFWPPIRYG